MEQTGAEGKAGTSLASRHRVVHVAPVRMVMRAGVRQDAHSRPEVQAVRPAVSAVAVAAPDSEAIRSLVAVARVVVHLVATPLGTLGAGSLSAEIVTVADQEPAIPGAMLASAMHHVVTPEAEMREAEMAERVAREAVVRGPEVAVLEVQEVVAPEVAALEAVPAIVAQPNAEPVLVIPDTGTPAAVIPAGVIPAEAQEVLLGVPLATVHVMTAAAMTGVTTGAVTNRVLASSVPTVVIVSLVETLDLAATVPLAGKRELDETAPLVATEHQTGHPAAIVAPLAIGRAVPTIAADLDRDAMDAQHQRDARHALAPKETRPSVAAVARVIPVHGAPPTGVRAMTAVPAMTVDLVAIHVTIALVLGRRERIGRTIATRGPPEEQSQIDDGTPGLAATGHRLSRKAADANSTGVTTEGGVLVRSVATEVRAGAVHSSVRANRLVRQVVLPFLNGSSVGVKNERCRFRRMSILVNSTRQSALSCVR